MKRKFKQFHQYQQNEQSPLSLKIIEHKKDHDMALEIQVPYVGTGTKMWWG